MRKGNIFVDFNGKGQPVLSNKTGQFDFWVLDDSNLTEMDKAILEAVNFPKVVKLGKAVQKRIRRVKSRRGFVETQQVKISDISYLPIAKKVAIGQVAKMSIRKNGVPGEMIERQQNAIEDIKATKQFEAYYLNGSGMDEELSLLLSTFSQPKATPNMGGAVVEATKEATKVTEIEEPSVKALSPTHKSKAKELYAASKDADEIAEALGVDKQRVIEYLKTLVKS